MKQDARKISKRFPTSCANREPLLKGLNILSIPFSILVLYSQALPLISLNNRAFIWVSTCNSLLYSRDPIKSTVLIVYRAEKMFMYGTYNRVLMDFWQTVLLIGTGQLFHNSEYTVDFIWKCIWNFELINFSLIKLHLGYCTWVALLKFLKF